MPEYGGHWHILAGVLLRQSKCTKVMICKLVVVVESFRRFKVYLIGVRFKVITDCNALRGKLLKRDLVPSIDR